jgi:hypothetical protein
MTNWIPIPVDELNHLMKGDKIRYVKRKNEKKVTGFVQHEWVKKDDPDTKGLVMAFSPKPKKGDKTWTISYNGIDECEKEVNKYFYFEFQYLRNQMNS